MKPKPALVRLPAVVRERASLVARGSLAAPERKPPTEIRVFKKGNVATTKGMFLFDDAAGASVMKAWKSYGNDLCFDYEHYSVSGDSPGDGKAAGWFKLELRDDGLYAVDIKWTDQAATQIAKAEWRYFSPTFDFDKKTGRILELVNVALTNIPATKNLPALVAAANKGTAMSTTKKKASPMKPKTKAEIANAKLGLKKTKKTVTETEEDTAAAEEADGAEMDGGELDEAEADEAEADDADLDDAEADDADMDDADADESDSDDSDDDSDSDDDDDSSDSDDTAKAKKMKKTSRGPSSHDRAILAAVHELTGGKTGSEAIGVLRGLRANSDTVAQLSQQVDALRRTSRRERVKVAVDAAVKCGKLMPAQREAFTKIGMRDIKELKGILDTMPKRVRMTGEEVIESGAVGATEMTEREREIVQRAGSADLYAEAKKAGKLMSLDRFVTGNEN